MDKILNKLYYDDKLGIAGKNNFIKKVRELHPDFKIKNITEWLNNQSIIKSIQQLPSNIIIKLQQIQNHFKLI